MQKISVMILSKRQRGFSLLEILVAFSILALSLGVLLRVFSTNVRLAAVSDDYAKAVLVAESVLAEATADTLEEGESSGNYGEHFQWTVSIKPFDPELEELDIDILPVQLYQIQVRVEWGSEQNPRNVTLMTLRLQSKTSRRP